MENSAFRSGYFEPPVPLPFCAVAGLRHEAGDHPMERHAVVEALARELLEPRSVAGRDVVAQLDDDAALRGVDQQRVLRVGAGRQARAWAKAGAASSSAATKASMRIM